MTPTARNLIFVVRHDAVSAVGLGVLGLLLVPGLWQGLVWLGVLDPVFVSSPTQIAVALPRAWAAGELPRDLAATTLALGLGLALAALVGVGLGLAMGLQPTLGAAFGPFVWFGYAAPVVAFYPLIVVWVGLGLPAVITIVAVLSVTPIAINTLLGVRAADRHLVRAVRSFGVHTLGLVWLVVLPGAVPYMVAGLRIGVGRALIGVVLGEMFSANAGLGYRLTYYGARLRTTEVLVQVVVIVALGVLLTQALRLVEVRAGRWRAG
jgi:NitT/TauT family transport system permease protein